MKINNIFKAVDHWCNKVYDWFINFIDKYGFICILVLIAIGSIVLRCVLFPFPSHDLVSFIFPWIKNFRENGNFAYLSQMQGDYLPLYMTFLAFISLFPGGKEITAYQYTYLQNDMIAVKSLSYIFDILMAIGIYLIVTHLYKENKGLRLISFAVALLLPTVLTNSGFWGQCDVLHTGCIIWAVYFLIKEKPLGSSIFLGLAFAFKIQAIFIVPLFGLAWLHKKFPLRYFLVSFLTIFITFLPCYFAGAHFLTPFMKYGNLTTEYMDPNLNSGSMYTFIQDIYHNKPAEMKKLAYEIIHIAGIIFALIATVTTWFTLYLKKIKLGAKSIVAIGALFSILMPFVMPHMHERYFYVADIMVLLYCLVNKKKYYLIILMQLSSMITLMWYTFDSTMIDAWGVDTFKISTIINAFIILILFKDILAMPKIEENNEMLLENSIN